MQKRIVFYDLETTGIDTKKDRIVEIAAQDQDNGSFSSLINPEISIPKDASDIHHITDDMVCDSPKFMDIHNDFLKFCGENVVLIAHNNDNFDKLILNEESKRASIELPQFSYVDSLKWAKRFRPDLPSHSLQSLREVYGISTKNSHRALDDVMVLKELFSRMTEDLSIDTIIELLYEPLKYMPFGKHKGMELSKLPRGYVEWIKSSGIMEDEQQKELRDALEKSNPHW